jgi:hypothetical protein
MFKKDRHAKVPQDVNKLIREVLTLVRSDAETQRVEIPDLSVASSFASASIWAM